MLANLQDCDAGPEKQRKSITSSIGQRHETSLRKPYYIYSSITCGAVPHSSQLISVSSVMNGLSSPTTTLSHRGQLPAKVSSSSARSFSILLSSNVLIGLCPPPMPGIQFAGAKTKLASASGTIKSRSLSPAEITLRPNKFAARAGFANPKLVDKSVRCFVGCLTGTFFEGGIIAGMTDLSTNWSWRLTIFRKACAGRYSFACRDTVSKSISSCCDDAHQSNETIRMEAVSTRKHVELSE